MIYLTGDIHCEIPGHWEQEKAGSELDATKKWLEILKAYKIKSTLFINGKCLEETPTRVKELLEYETELGGHTYQNFGKMNLFKSYINRKVYGCVYGSLSFQKKDIQKTKMSFERLGLKMNSWRTHAFASNNETFRLLQKAGVKYVSDLFGEQGPFEKNGIIHMPMNIPVDVVSVAYGILRPENRDPFASCTKGRISPEEWFDLLKKRVNKNERDKKDSVLLIHPITMAVMDDFKLFRKIAKFLSKYKSAKMSECSI